MEWFEAYVNGGTWVDPLTALVGAFVFGQLLAWTYEYTYQGLSYSRGFSHTIVLVGIAAATLVLAMHHSLIAGLGLFGILSMIRFRTDLKTPRDLVFVMGAATVGVACGTSLITIAAMGSGVFSLVALYLYTGPFGARTRFDGVLRFRVPAGIDVEPQLGALLDQYCRRQSLLSLTDIAQGSAREHVYQVKFFRSHDQNALLAELREHVDAHDARLLLQDASSEY